jgi:tripartite-type tricarboxylate transporter receptor subunit TctC
LPTVDEQGIKGFLAVAWNGVTAPARTPRAVIDKINADVQKIVKMPAIIERFKADGADPAGYSVEQYQKFLRDETAKWARVIKLAGVKGL